MTLSVRPYDLSAASGKRNARAEQTQVRCPSEGSGEPSGEDDDAAGGRKSVIVIGGGPGGYVAAIRAAQLGADVTVVEKQYLGGTCLNVGCIPTKCLLHSAELVEQIKTQGRDIGVEVDGVRVNFPQVIAHKNAISKQLTSGVAGLLKLNKVKKIDGEAKFIGEKKLSVKKADGTVQEMTADAIIVATGSVNAQPPIPGLKENPNCIDSTGALSLEKLPRTMVVIGGGVIGLELACAYAAFGTKITVVEAMDHMLPMLDGDLTKIGVAHMKKMGMEFHLECPVQAVEASPVGAKVVCRDKSGRTVSFEAEKVLVAIGRRANTAGLDLAAGNIGNDKGRILVNDRMQTNVPGVYAIGDCVFGHAQLAHTASAMGEVASENICGLEAHYCEKTNPTCVYMEPEAASVGLTEEQCKAQGITLYDRLQEIFARYGTFVEKVVSTTLPGKDGVARMKEIMKGLRAEHPKEIGGLAVTAVRDYLKGVRVADGVETPTGLPASDVLYFELEGGNWVCVRPSGTEPKIKLYVNTNDKDGAAAHALNEKLCAASEAMMK